MTDPLSAALLLYLIIPYLSQQNYKWPESQLEALSKQKALLSAAAHKTR